MTTESGRPPEGGEATPTEVHEAYCALRRASVDGFDAALARYTGAWLRAAMARRSAAPEPAGPCKQCGGLAACWCDQPRGAEAPPGVGDGAIWRPVLDRTAVYLAKHAGPEMATIPTFDLWVLYHATLDGRRSASVSADGEPVDAAAEWFTQDERERAAERERVLWGALQEIAAGRTQADLVIGEEQADTLCAARLAAIARRALASEGGDGK